MTYAELVRKFFPGVSDEQVDFILWEKTGFPGFWNIGVDGNTPEECLIKQLQDFKDEINTKNK